MELVKESLVHNATQEITKIQNSFIKSNFDINKQKQALTNLADPEFIPRSLRLKIAMSALSFVSESPILNCNSKKHLYPTSRNSPRFASSPSCHSIQT
mmetsp:Transcript_11553/g.16481  ORF Transcript_11553/g.16481 Transcript_11553/m.16481 type:complete len:98 (-) Transcript_11553:444-737(-)